jgi:hypothetical protein
MRTVLRLNAKNIGVVCIGNNKLVFVAGMSEIENLTYPVPLN